MSSRDFIPRRDANFNLWQDSLVEYTEQNLIPWGIAENDFTALKSIQRNWIIAFTKASNKQNRTAADVMAKDEAGVDFKKVIRVFVAQWLANNTNVNDADRTRMGLTVKTGTRTATLKPASYPVATIDFSTRLRHTIHFSDEASPLRKAKPEGVHGCEIYMKVDGDAPRDVTEMTYVATNTATPYVLTFDGTKAGKTIYYWLRWVNTRGECGPWSNTISAMVVG